MSGIVAQNVGRRSGLIKTVAAGGEWTLISTTTASSDATISFTSGLDSTYDEYCFKFINIHPENDAVSFQFNGSIDAGSNYNVSKTTSAFGAYHDEADSGTALSYDTARDIAEGTGVAILTHKGTLGNDNDQCLDGYFYLFSPSSTTFVKHFISRITYYEYSNYAMDSYTGGYLNTTSAVDAIQFSMSGGDIDTGTISLYGIG